jgi:hypothetical protein
MATEIWVAGAQSLVSVLSSELNALADGAYSNQGTAVDNTVNGDRFAIAQLDVTFGSNPTAEAILDLYMVVSLDGTNYPDAANGQTTPGVYKVGSFQVRAVTSAQKIVTAVFEMRGPFKHKFQLRNRSGQALPAAPTVKVSTFNRSV